MGYGDEFNDTIEKYQMNLIYLLDTSGSMYGERINQLNVAMAEAIQVAVEEAARREIELRMRVVEFNSSPKWIYGGVSDYVDHIDWTPLTAGGGTDTAGAIDMACEVMHREYLGTRNLRPVVILVTDGESNDPRATVAAAERLRRSLVSSKDPNKDKVTRIALGVCDANEAELTAFASVGTIEDEAGEVKENVPFVFSVNDVSLLSGLLKNLTVSSIASSLAGGLAEDQGAEVVVLSVADDESDDFED